MLGSWAPSTYSLGKFNIPTYLLESAKSSSRALPARERESTNQPGAAVRDGRTACLRACVRLARSDTSRSPRHLRNACATSWLPSLQPPRRHGSSQLPTGCARKINSVFREKLAICHVAQHRGRVAVPVAEPQPRARRRRRSTEPSRSFRGAPWSQSKH